MIQKPMINNWLFLLVFKYVGLQNLVQRNEQLYCSGDAPSGGVALPFILVQVKNGFLLFIYCLQ
jgi:transcription factor Dp-1